MQEVRRRHISATWLLTRGTELGGSLGLNSVLLSDYLSRSELEVQSCIHQLHGVVLRWLGETHDVPRVKVSDDISMLMDILDSSSLQQKKQRTQKMPSGPTVSVFQEATVALLGAARYHQLFDAWTSSFVPRQQLCIGSTVPGSGRYPRMPRGQSPFRSPSS